MGARLPDWRERLGAYLSDCARRPFAYGSHDCATFASGAVLAMTGQDLRAAWGAYGSRAQGLAMLRERGFPDHLALARAVLEPIAVDLAGPGDVAVIRGVALGIVQGRRVYVAAPGGLAAVPVEEATEAFRL